MNVAFTAQENSLLPPCAFSENEFMAGYSKASEAVCKNLEKIREHYLTPVTRQKLSQVWCDALRDIVESKCTEGWDGYDAAPVSEQTLKEAYKFISLLPPSLPVPEEISADPDGDISLEWYRNTNYLLTISISEKKTISYAGVFGPYSKVHGTEYFDFKIPKSILDNIKKLKQN